MADETSGLRRLLRAQLTAVNQQFTHILALRTIGETGLADRIEIVDRVDFAVSMQVMDHLVRRGEPLALRFAGFAPGETVPEICAAELRVERLMAACLAPEAPLPALEMIERARGPRKAYVDWLVARGAVPQDPAVLSEAEPMALDALFSELMAVIEQSMAHAFVHWHRGDRRDADVAWATSGVAMLQGRRLTRALAGTGRTPKAVAEARLAISEAPEGAAVADRALARRCAAAAGPAAAASPDAVAGICREIGGFWRETADHRDGDHPSSLATSPAFRSFERTLAKCVH
ncbi:MAG: hypothetical protein AAF074_13325 [Pseudomonadota bacterium]